MSYEHTEVPVVRSQDGIRKLVMAHNGFGIAFLTDRPQDLNEDWREGFQAKVIISKQPTVVQIMCKLKRPSRNASDRQKELFVSQEERRVWRVLFWHLKSVFEASDSGVMEFRELMMPYIVMADGKTVAAHLLPRLDAGIDPSRLLGDGSAATEASEAIRPQTFEP